MSQAVEAIVAFYAIVGLWLGLNALGDWIADRLDQRCPRGHRT